MDFNPVADGHNEDWAKVNPKSSIAPCLRAVCVLTLVTCRLLRKQTARSR